MFKKPGLAIVIPMLILVCTSVRLFAQSDSLELNAYNSYFKALDSLELNANKSAVVPFDDDTLFYIYLKIGAFTPQHRAQAISQRINALASVINFIPDSLSIVHYDLASEIYYKDEVILSITEYDARAVNLTREQLSEEYLEKIIISIDSYKERHNWISLIKKIGIGLFVLFVLFGIIKLLGKLFSWTEKKIYEQEGKLISGIKIRNYTLYDVKSELRLFTRLNNVIKWVFIILAIYISLPALFSIFPWTEKLADTLLGFILDPLKKIATAFWKYLPNIFTIAVIVFVFRYFIKLLRFLKVEVERNRLSIPGFYPEWANPTFQIIRLLTLAFMLVVIFPYLPGSDSPIFKGVSVFLGFLLTFGSAGALSNVISGLVLTYMRLYKLGDRVTIGNQTGDVVERNMLVTRIRTIKNEIVSIPNSMVMSNHTVNFSSEAESKGLIIHSTITIGYDVPWKDIQESLIEAASRTEHILKDPAPFVYQMSLDDFYVSYQINAYIKQANKQGAIYSELHKNILDVFNTKGIEIMSPHYNSLRDGNKIAIPDTNLPKDYNSPAFKVDNTTTPSKD